MNFEIYKQLPPKEQFDAQVLFVRQATKVGPKESGKKSAAKVDSTSKLELGGIPAELKTKMLDYANAADAISGKVGDCVLFRDCYINQAQHLIAVGISRSGATGSTGKKQQDRASSEDIRIAIAHAVSQLKAVKAKSAAILVDSIGKSDADAYEIGKALSESIQMSTYQFTDFKKSPNGDSLTSVALISSEKSKNFDMGVKDGTAVAEAVCFARRLGDRPGNQMTPSILADETVKAAAKSKLKVTVWDKAKIKAEKMNSFLSVALGSNQEPKFIVMEYRGGAKSKRPVCFVGKGLTFDSGGISLKPSAGMEEMKYDMCGGAAVIGTMLAIARLGLKINAIGLVPATENMPGPGANKPGDIVVARNGKSIEINNTDAEGRLILNDALDYASELDPCAIVDAATLTGAMVVALGNLHTGFFTRNDDLAAKIQKAAERSGEWVWRMPLTDFHVRDMKGSYADLSNISSSKGAGSATAAAFLEQFVNPDIPWAHFDVAGTAWHAGDRWPYNPKKGATGVMVRTFVELAKILG